MGDYSLHTFIAALKNGDTSGSAISHLACFLPNTCYLLTEWRHFLGQVLHSDLYRQADTNHTALFRLNVAALYYILYSGLGVFFFTLAIRPIERSFRILGWYFPLFAPFLFLFISVGVYLGLILRLNSWYVLTKPEVVFTSILGITHSKALVLAIIVFMMVIWALYEGLDLWLDALIDRVSFLSAKVHIRRE
jgi:uncharacterized membrane protein